MTDLSELIRQDPPLSYGASAAYKYTPALERKYKFTDRFEQEVLLHRREGDLIHLPRALCPVGPHDQRALGDHALFAQSPTPRPNQVQLFKDVQEMMNKAQSGLVVAPTGFGKTLLGYL